MDSTSPNIDILRQLYRESPVAKAFFDHAARREYDQSETKVDRILVLLRAEKHPFFQRRDIIALFRQLQDCGCGQFVERQAGMAIAICLGRGVEKCGTSGRRGVAADCLNLD